MIRQGWLAGALAVMTLTLACDRSPTAVTTLPQKPASTLPAGPTTQELLAGPYKKVSLTPLPMSAQVPQSWEVKMPEGTDFTFLEGPGPDGQMIQISLELGTPQTPEKLKNILTHAQRDADNDKQTYRLFRIKNVGDIQVIEQQKVFSGDVNGAQKQLIDWKLTYFVHRDIDFVPCVVDVLGLTSERFEMDKELLQKIFDSITDQPL